MCRPSRPCISLVLIRSQFSTGWLMSSFATETNPSPQQTRTPAELFSKREPTTHLSLAKPSLQRHVEKKQVASKLYKDGLHPKGRMLNLYQPVRVKKHQGREGEMDNGHNCGCEGSRNLPSSSSG